MRLLKTTPALLVLTVALLVPASAQALPAGFFGVAPQTTLTDADTQYMSAGGLESIRVPVPWSAIQPTAAGGYHWEGFDATVAVAARARLRILPFLYGTPRWLSSKPAALPIDNARERNAWTAFVQAAVARYGPHGQFWLDHRPFFSAEPVPKRPIRTWQVWNEANFFYFAFPVSPTRYAKLLKLTHATINGADPGAKVILSGLFGKPDQGGRRGMPAAKFLGALYRVPGIKADFDGVALHPYAVNTAMLKRLVEGVHSVTAKNHDHAPLYITEMGWGSQSDFHKVAFEQGAGGQARELRGAYRYLIANQRRLKLKGTFWFSWKDIPNACTFCDSVGLFQVGPGFTPKPAWRAFVSLTGGRVRP